MNTPTLLVDAKNSLGECVLWCDRTGRVLWTDILGATLWSHEPGTGRTRSWPMPEELSCFALTNDDNRLLLGLASGLAVFDFAAATIAPLHTVEADLPGTRLNDGRCDRQGRFVFGMFNRNVPRDPIGGFYRLNTDLTLERLPLPPAAIANSICFSPDGATMYFCDSPHRAISCCDYGDTLGTPRLFATLDNQLGEPDGSTVDADGYLWNAEWGSSRLVRYAPDGRVNRVVGLPVSQPSCVAFGGPGLDVLYATSARQWLDDAQLAAQPAAGGLFAVASDGVRGLPEQRFHLP